MTDMKYWLLKSEPESWSYADQVKKGAKGEPWSGVRNFQARKNLQAMQKGDRAFFYHTGDEKAVVGIVEVLGDSYPDPTAKKDEPWVVVDVKAVAAMPKPVALAAIKQEARLKDMVLVKAARLSVQPVTEAEWKIVCKMGGMK
jgi:predicted RNA-binding protein with PUA-like domain